MRWLIAPGLFLLYLPLAGAVVRLVATESYAGHLLFVPFVSAVILWNRRSRFSATTGLANRAGAALVGIALALLALAHASQSYTTHVISLVLALAGVVVWRGGSGWLQQAAFPLGFLLLLLPPPRGLMTAVSPTIQRAVAGFSAGTLTLLGIPVEQQEFTLHLRNATLSVDEGCNGLRFLLVLFVISTALAQLLIAARSRQWLLMIAAVPAAALANALRVTELAVAVHLFGPWAATGWAHDYIGRATWLLTIAVLLALALALRRTAPASRQSPWVQSPQPKRI